MSARIADPIAEPHLTIDGRAWNIPSELQVIATQNDENSEVVKIDIPRYFDGIDRATFEIYLRTISDEGGLDEVIFTPNELEVTADTIVATWSLKPPQTSFSGPLRLHIVIRNGEDYQWSSYYGTVTIKELKDAEPVFPVTPSTYDYWLERVTTASLAAESSAASAASDAKSAKTSSTSAASSAAMTKQDKTYVAEARAEVASNAEIVQRIGDAVKAGKSPVIGNNGNWHIWNIDSYVDSGEPSQGKSAYDYAKEAGYTGTETQFSEKLSKEALPTVTASDKGKFLRVSNNGVWVAATVHNAEEVSF